MPNNWAEQKWYLVTHRDPNDGMPRVSTCQISYAVTYEYDLFDDTPYDTEEDAQAAAYRALAKAKRQVQLLRGFQL